MGHGLVYVAAASRDRERARSVATRLRAYGYRIAFAWWRGPFAPSDGLLPAQDRARLQGACLNGARMADRFVLLLPHEGTTVGAWVELGAFLDAVGEAGGERPVLVAGPRPASLFLAGALWFPSDEALVRTLDPSLPLVDTAFSATKDLLVETFDADKVISALRLQMVRGAKEAIRSIPSLEEIFTSWLTQLRKGRFTVYVDTSDVSKQISELDDALTLNVRRLTLALLLVGLLVGASIASNTPADLVPNMAELAYLIFISAAILAGVVILRAVLGWLNGDKL